MAVGSIPTEGVFFHFFFGDKTRKKNALGFSKMRLRGLGFTKTENKATLKKIEKQTKKSKRAKKSQKKKSIKVKKKFKKVQKTLKKSKKDQKPS